MYLSEAETDDMTELHPNTENHEAHGEIQEGL